MTPGARLKLAAEAVPFTHYERGWIYGIWYCGTSFRPAVHYGAFPHGFVQRIQACFPDEPVLHLCCGKAKVPGWLNVDMNRELGPDVVADVETLPLPDNSFQVALIDPPYSEEDASRYKVPRLIRAGKVIDEAWRVLANGGWLLWLDEKYPSYRRTEWKLDGLIGIATGFERRARWLCWLRKRGARQFKMDLAK